MPGSFFEEDLCRELAVTRGEEHQLCLPDITDQIFEALLADKFANESLVFEQQEVTLVLDLVVILFHRVRVVGDSMARDMDHLWCLAQHLHKVGLRGDGTLEYNPAFCFLSSGLNVLDLSLELKGREDQVVVSVIYGAGNLAERRRKQEADM